MLLRSASVALTLAACLLAACGSNDDASGDGATDGTSSGRIGDVCEEDGECAAALYCQKGRGVCVECVADGECGDSATCEDFRCIGEDGLPVNGGDGSGGDGSGGDGASGGGSGSGGEASGGASDGGASVGGNGAGGSLGGSGTGGAVTGGTGGSGAGGAGGAGLSCSASQTPAAEGVCVPLGTIDDFGSCNTDIYEAEGRKGSWYWYRGETLGGDEGVSAPPWPAPGCAAWSAGGYDPLYPPELNDYYAGIGLTLQDDTTTYDACDYSNITVTYASDDPVVMYLKWEDTGVAGTRAMVELPATSGGTITSRTIQFSSFTGLDCSELTEVQFEPDGVIGWGFAVYGVEFGGGTFTCSNGDTRCDSSTTLETCNSAGTWVPSACGAGTTCRSGSCVDADATPVSIHGHLSVNGTQLVDESGNAVQLKGISSQWLNLEDDAYATNKSAMEWMRDNWGITLFRAAMGADSAGGAAAGGYFDGTAARADMIAQVRAIIDNAIDLGIYVLVDWHTHERNQAAAIEFFEMIAEDYGQYPNVIIETFNEPLMEGSGPQDYWDSYLRPYHKAVVDAFRAKDPNNATHPNVAVLGTPNWDQDAWVVAGKEVVGTNLMYTTHFYSCTHPWSNTAGSVAKRAQDALSAGVPLFVTEWGASHADGGTSSNPGVCGSEANGWHTWMDTNKISWAAWKLSDCDYEVTANGVADETCLLTKDAPLSGGWTSSYLNGHASYVVSKL